MRAYTNIKLTEAPDVADIRCEGRRSAVGRLRRGEVSYRWKNNIVALADGTPGTFLGRVCNNDRGYNRPGAKARTRRYLKHVDRAASARFDRLAEGC